MNNPVSRYVSNVKKAAGDFMAAGEAADKARRIERGVAAADKLANEKRGQLLGAILQNRTYVDRKTGKAIK